MAGSYSVFVSHSAKDGQYIELIRGALRGTGARPYIAEEVVSPGAKLSNKIRTKIEECEIFLLLLTENSMSSSFVNQEIGYALGLEKFVLPVAIGGACPSNLCSDIEYIRLDPSNPMPAMKTIRAVVKAKKNDEDLAELAAAGVVALGVIGWMKYGPQIKQTLSTWWQNLNRPPP